MGSGVHDTGGCRGLLHELLDAGGVRGDLVRHGGEPAVGLGGEAEPVQGRCAVTDHGRQVAAGQGEGDGPPRQPGRHRREHHVGTRGALGAETAADVFGDDRDPFRGHLEQRGQGVPYDRGALAGVVHGQPVAVPAGGGGVRFHRVVVQRRHPVGGVDPYGGGVEGAIRVAPFGAGRIAGVGLLGDVRLRVRGGEGDVVRFRGVRDAHRGGAGPGVLGGLGHHEGDEPAAVRDFGVLQYREGGVVRLGEPGRVVVGEHGQHAGQGQRGRRVDAGHPAPGDGGGHRPGERPVRAGLLGRVAGRAGDLLPPFPALGGSTHDGTDAGHTVLLRAPVQVLADAVSRVRTSRARARARGTL